MADYKKYIMSTTTHYISNSGSDENGNTHGGKAGDQTGKEWQLRAWYKRPWTCVLRWPDINVGTLLAQLGIDAALNNKIGYDQHQRDSFWKEVQKVGYLPAKVKTACEEDCTAGDNALVHCAAYLLDIPALKSIPETGIRSGNMRAVYKKAGFQVLTADKYLSSPNYLLPGDILLYDNHHSAMNVTKGKSVSYTYRDVINNLSAYKGGQSAPAAGGTTSGTVLKKGDKGAAVKELQQNLIKLGYDCGPYKADGDFGADTETALKKFQQDHNLAADGEYGPKTSAAMKQALAGTSAKKVKITGNLVNVRSAPGTDSRILGTVSSGKVLDYQGEYKTVNGTPWYLVIFNGENGWVSGKFAEVV